MAVSCERVKGSGFHFDAGEPLARFPFPAYFHTRAWLPCCALAVDPLTREEAVARHHVAVLVGSVLCAAPLVAQGVAVASSEPVSLIIRSDDAGMSHSVNMALQRLMDSGLPLSVSVMFACPWYQETVEILKRHPDVAVGIHLTLNSEWKNYRWGPILGRTAVPTLVDSNGYFFSTSEALRQHNADPREVEQEFRAQIDRALKSGLKIDYVDFHMGTATRYPEFRDVTERLAREFGLGMSTYFGEAEWDPQYRAAPAQKIDSLATMIDRLQPGYNL